jgi:3-methyladenine DNA glycosylase AlkD
MRSSKIRSVIKVCGNKDHAATMQRFFKTGKGEYGEGDIFLGIKVPVQRQIAKQFRDLSFDDIGELIKSKIHEERLISLFILVDQYQKTDEEGKKKIYSFYLKNRKYVNNWDLVDLSAPKIIGKHLLNRNKSTLISYAKSSKLWEKRIAMLATYTFIKNGNFKTTLKISDILLKDKHDLIHKAVGWMLREIGKVDVKVVEEYLRDRYKKMPRTMLRYAIEKFPEEKRKKYLAGKI